VRALRPRLDALELGGRRAISECETLATLRDALLPGLMSGKIRVYDAEQAVEEAI
jgi:hypothetical protein